MLNLKINEILIPNSTSPTIVCKGVNSMGKAIYLKIYLNNSHYLNQALSYEGSMYQYLKCKSIKGNEFEKSIEEYMIGLDLFLDNITIKEFFEQVTFDSNLKSEFITRYQSLKKKFLFEGYFSDDIIGIICTYDYGGISLKKYLYTLNDETFTEKTIFLNLSIIFIVLINGIYLLNKMGINHNDMHFSNIIIINNTPTTYNIFINSDKPTIFKSNFKIVFYDFDRSYFLNNPNPLLEFKCKYDNHSGCNKETLRDLFVLIRLINIYLNKINKIKKIGLFSYTHIHKFFTFLFETLVPNEDKRKQLIEYDKYVLDNNIFWSNFCAIINGKLVCDNMNSNVVNDHYQWLTTIFDNIYNIINILTKPNTFINPHLELEEITESSKNGFRLKSKYLKYKNKYLTIKYT